MPKRREPADSLSHLLDQLAHTGCGVMAVDANQKILLWNRAAEDLLGHAAKQALGQSCYDMVQFHAGDGALTCCKNCSPITQARRHHWPSHQLLRIRKNSRQDAWLHLITFPLFFPSQELSTLLHVFWSAAESQEVSSSGLSAEAHAIADSQLLWLSQREIGVLRCMAAGMDTKTTATLLFISPTTVRNHTQSILKKLKVHSRLEAVALAHQHHWA